MATEATAMMAATATVEETAATAATVEETAATATAAADETSASVCKECKECKECNGCICLPFEIMGTGYGEKCDRTGWSTLSAARACDRCSTCFRCKEHLYKCEGDPCIKCNKCMRACQYGRNYFANKCTGKK